MAKLGRPISERLQAFARNERLKRRIGARQKALSMALSSTVAARWYTSRPRETPPPRATASAGSWFAVASGCLIPCTKSKI
jgi:hypothetical protein